MSVLLCGDFSAAAQADWLRILSACAGGEHWITSRDQADERMIDIAVVANPSPGTLQGLPGLRLIQSLWAGVDRLLADASLPPGVPIARMVDPAMNEPWQKRPSGRCLHCSATSSCTRASSD